MWYPPEAGKFFGKIRGSTNYVVISFGLIESNYKTIVIIGMGGAGGC
jgi:hypothetical protein